ncbi:MAG: DeoR family transcriptional regulator, partial [Candidatus Woesearchaeota archaeon]
VEKWGSGLRRIYEECASQGVKVEFEVLQYGFSVIFYRSKSDTNRTQIGHKSGTNPAQIRQEWILEYLKKHKEIRNSVIVKEFSINRDTARNDLNKLLNQDKIIKKGAGNNVWYELK